MMPTSRAACSGSMRVRSSLRVSLDWWALTAAQGLRKGQVVVRLGVAALKLGPLQSLLAPPSQDGLTGLDHVHMTTAKGWH